MAKNLERMEKLDEALRQASRYLMEAERQAEMLDMRGMVDDLASQRNQIRRNRDALDFERDKRPGMSLAPGSINVRTEHGLHHLPAGTPEATVASRLGELGIDPSTLMNSEHLQATHPAMRTPTGMEKNQDFSSQAPAGHPAAGGSASE